MCELGTLEKCNEEVQVCKKCGEINYDGVNFCQHCGDMLVDLTYVFCNICGTKNFTANKYCDECNIKL
ncbi:zinc-ribbon domain-containing protein [Terrisporobacter sp.]|uniref:zinc-ribbon domain-containing protein n=1 Tax=Terrisporobacter sp. TaxID=1965305 RepID=UPI0026157880|nr:zinc ribbon domain-containing protein [Terrisporobacter sp.]